MASNNFHIKTKSMKCKLWLLILLQITFTIHIILAYVDSSYWMYPYSNFSLVWVLQLIITLLQIYIIRKQHKKKVIKSYNLPVLWICWFGFNVSMIIFTEIVVPNVSILLLITTAAVQLLLVVVGILVESKGNRQNAQDELINSNIHQSQYINTTTMESPLINNNTSRNNKTTITAQQHLQDPESIPRLYVQFNRQFNIINKSSSKIYCQFKFAVFIGQQSYILNKSQQQFTQLATQMVKACPQCEQVRLKEYKRNTISNMKKYGEEMQKYYQTYLVQLAKNQKFYIMPLLDFLDINPIYRNRLIKKRQKNIYQKKDSFPNCQYEDQKNHKPFFKVEAVNNKIHISNPEILEIIVNKSKTDIQKFHNKLITQKRLKMQLLTSDPDISEMTHFIYRVVNTKNLWRYFSEWMVLGKQLQQKIYHMFDFWTYGFKNININIIGYEIAFDKQGSIHNLYLLSLTQKVKINSNNIQDEKLYFFKEDFTLKKRYNDFAKLDRNIRKFISTNNIKNTSIMSLPPKFSPFGTKTSPKSRQVYLDMYLNQALRIQNINHCVKFLQFLEVDLGRFREEFYPVNQEELASQHISSFIIDELENRF